MPPPQPAAECVRAGKTVEDRQRDGRRGAACAPEPQRRSGEGGASPAGCGRGRRQPGARRSRGSARGHSKCKCPEVEVPQE